MSKFTLLNGEEWSKDELELRMYDDDFYYNFLGRNALSSSVCKNLLRGVKYYLKNLEFGKSSQALTDGKLIHLFALEPHRMEELKVVDATTKTTKAYKEAKAQFGEVYLRKDIMKNQRITQNLFDNDEVASLIEQAEKEIPYFGSYNDMPFRVKVDMEIGDRIIDLKTSSDINSFKWDCKKYHYDLQAALYLEITGKTRFDFLVLDKFTGEMGLWETSESFIASGYDKLDRSIQVYKNYLEGEDPNQELISGVL